MQRFISIVSVCLISAGAAFAQHGHGGASASYESGESAYTRLDFDTARHIWYAAGEDENLSANERGDSLRALARVTWRLNQDADTALALLDRADEIDARDSDTFAQRAHALIHAGRYGDAYDAGVEAVALADDSAAQRDARIALAEASLASVGDTGPRAFTPEQRTQLRTALEALMPAIRNAPADLQTSELGVAIALRLGDGPALLAAWQSYYHHPSGVSAMADIAGPAEALQRALPVWDWRARDRNHLTVATALAESYFHHEAAYMTNALSALRDDAFLIRNRLYTNMIDEIDTTTVNYYRAYANGEMTGQDYGAAMGAMMVTHGAALYPDADISMETSAEFADMLREEFGTYASIGMTSGVLDLHMGHVTLDTDHAVSQYGYEATVGYAVVGRMVSNGYESWIWDGSQQHGGWASSTRIYQVRPAYANGPLRTWAQVTEPGLRAEADERLASLREADWALAEGGEAVYLPGLALALRQQGQRALYEDLAARVPAARLRSEFVTQLGNATRESSIFAHEGRHALDKVHIEDAQGVDLPSHELEFTAKLSEVAFAPYPRLAFGAIINGTLGNDTSHGIANERVVAGLIAWMEARRDEIAGLDGSRPLLPQFDLLTNAQMVAAVQSMDPWFAGLNTEATN